MKIVIVDYGMGNIRSIITTLNYLNVDDVILSNNKYDLEGADRIILPGVGNFDKAIKQINNIGLDVSLGNIVREKQTPLLGICLGMQLLGLSSTENGFNNGLSYVNGEVTKFESSQVKVPHVGFNQVDVNPNSKLFEGIKSGSDFYFTHSFRMHSSQDINQSFCFYQNEFIAAF